MNYVLSSSNEDPIPVAIVSRLPGFLLCTKVVTQAPTQDITPRIESAINAMKTAVSLTLILLPVRYLVGHSQEPIYVAHEYPTFCLSKTY